MTPSLQVRTPPGAARGSESTAVHFPEQIGWQICPDAHRSADSPENLGVGQTPRMNTGGDDAFGRDGGGGQILHGDDSPPVRVAEHTTRRAMTADFPEPGPPVTTRALRSSLFFSQLTSSLSAASRPTNRQAGSAGTSTPRARGKKCSRRSSTRSSCCSIRSWVSRSKPCS